MKISPFSRLQCRSHLLSPCLIQNTTRWRIRWSLEKPPRGATTRCLLHASFDYAGWIQGLRTEMGAKMKLLLQIFCYFLPFSKITGVIPDRLLMYKSKCCDLITKLLKRRMIIFFVPFSGTPQNVLAADLLGQPAHERSEWDSRSELGTHCQWRRDSQ